MPNNMYHNGDPYLTDYLSFNVNWLVDRPNQLTKLSKSKRWTSRNPKHVYSHLVNEFEKYEEEHYNPDNKNHLDSIRNALIENKIVLPGATDEEIITAFEQYPEGIVDSKKKLIIYKNMSPSTIIHERAHAMDHPASQVKFKRKFRQNGIEEDSYLDNNHEIYARLNELRFNNKINPSYTFTIEDIQRMRLDKSFKDENIFKRYTDEFILHLLNDVAYNETPSQQSLRSIDPVTLAKNGASLFLTPHKDYLGIPYKQDGDYNYFSAHPENMPTNPEEHWTSRNPTTGKLLKSEIHPTFDLMIKGEKDANMDIYQGLNGELYSYPKEQIVPLYLRKFNYGKR